MVVILLDLQHPIIPFIFRSQLNPFTAIQPVLQFFVPDHCSAILIAVQYSFDLFIILAQQVLPAQFIVIIVILVKFLITPPLIRFLKLLIALLQLLFTVTLVLFMLLPFIHVSLHEVLFFHVHHALRHFFLFLIFPNLTEFLDFLNAHREMFSKLNLF